MELDAQLQRHRAELDATASLVGALRNPDGRIHFAVGEASLSMDTPVVVHDNANVGAMRDELILARQNPTRDRNEVTVMREQRRWATHDAYRSTLAGALWLALESLLEAHPDRRKKTGAPAFDSRMLDAIDPLVRRFIVNAIEMERDPVDPDVRNLVHIKRPETEAELVRAVNEVLWTRQRRTSEVTLTMAVAAAARLVGTDARTVRRAWEDAGPEWSIDVVREFFAAERDKSRRVSAHD